MKKKKLHSLDIYVIFSISALIIYTIVSQLMIYFASVNNQVVSLDTLTTCFFGFFGGEIVTCALIKIFKLRGDRTEPEPTSNDPYKQLSDDEIAAMFPAQGNEGGDLG